MTPNARVIDDQGWLIPDPGYEHLGPQKGKTYTLRSYEKLGGVAAVSLMEGNPEDFYRACRAGLFLDAMAPKVGAKTQAQALNALAFLFEQVFQTREDFGKWRPAQRPRNIPEVLSQNEVHTLLARPASRAKSRCIPCAIHSPRTCWKAVWIFGRCRSFLDIATSRQPPSTCIASASSQAASPVRSMCSPRISSPSLSPHLLFLSAPDPSPVNSFLSPFIKTAQTPQRT